MSLLNFYSALSGSGTSIPTTTTLLLNLDGNFADSSANAYTITPTNCITSLTNAYPGFGQCAQFNGSSSTFSVPATALPSTGNFTIEGFFYWTTNAGGIPTFFSNRAGATNGVLFGIQASGPQLAMYSTGGLVGTGSTAIALNTWSHYALTFDGSNYRGFLNGLLQFTVSTATFVTFDRTHPIIFGDDSVGGNYYQGQQDDIRISNVCLYTVSFPNIVKVLGLNQQVNTQVYFNSSTSGTGFTLSNGNLTASGTTANVSSLANLGISSGKRYIEFAIGTVSTDYPGVGICGGNSSTFYNGRIGSVSPGASIKLGGGGLNVTGCTSNLSSTAAIVTGDVIGIALDASGNNAWISINGVWQNSGNPGAGTNPSVSSLPSATTWYPGITSSTSGSASINGSANSTVYQAPTGFSAWDGTTYPTLSLPTSTVWDFNSSAAAIVLSNSNKTATSSTATTTNTGIIGNVGVCYGQWYAEITLTSTTTGYPLIGAANNNNSTFYGTYPGGTSQGFSILPNTGAAYSSGITASWSAIGALSAGTVIGIAINLNSSFGYAWISINGVWQNSGNPVTNTSPAFSGLTGTWYLGAGFLNAVGAATINSTLTYTPPTGYTAWPAAVSAAQIDPNTAYYAGAFTLSGSNTVVTANNTGQPWAGIFIGNPYGHYWGKRYWEIKITGLNNYVAWGLTDGIPGAFAGGPNRVSYNNQPVTNAAGVITQNGGLSPVAFAVNDTFCIACDYNAGNLWLGKNGTWLSAGGVGNPTTGANPGWTGVTGSCRPILSMYASTTNQLTYAGTATAFNYPRPQGFLAMDGT